MKRLGIYLVPIEGMVVHRRSFPRTLLRFPNNLYHLYYWVERGTMRVKCLAQEHNLVSPARARTRAARSGNERTNYETTDNAGNFQCKNRYREQKNKLPAKTYPSPVFLVRKFSDYKTNLHQKMQKGYKIWTESSQRVETTSRRLSFE